MYIGNKSSISQWLWPEAGNSSYIEALKNRVNAYSITVLYLVIESLGDAVDEYQIDFHVGNAVGFYEIFDRTGKVELGLETLIPPVKY